MKNVKKLDLLRAHFTEQINDLQKEKLKTKLQTREYQIIIEQAVLRGKVELIDELKQAINE